MIKYTQIFFLILTLTLLISCGGDDELIEHDEPSMMYDGIQGGIWVLSKGVLYDCDQDEPDAVMDTTYLFDNSDYYWYGSFSSTSISTTYKNEDDEEVDFTYDYTITTSEIDICPDCNYSDLLPYRIDGNEMTITRYDDSDDCWVDLVYNRIDPIGSLGNKDLENTTWDLKTIEWTNCDVSNSNLEGQLYESNTEELVSFRDETVMSDDGALWYNSNNSIQSVEYRVKDNTIAFCNVCTPFNFNAFSINGTEMVITVNRSDNCDLILTYIKK